MITYGGIATKTRGEGEKNQIQQWLEQCAHAMTAGKKQQQQQQQLFQKQMAANMTAMQQQMAAHQMNA